MNPDDDNDICEWHAWFSEQCALQLGTVGMYVNMDGKTVLATHALRANDVRKPLKQMIAADDVKYLGVVKQFLGVQSYIAPAQSDDFFNEGV